MNDAALFQATVPVFRHYMHRIEVLLQKLPIDSQQLLDQKLAPDAFSAAEHLETAIGFSLRTVLPMVSSEYVDYESQTLDRQRLEQLTKETISTLEALTPADFTDASRRTIPYTAGDATLEQDATTYVTLFALPNFFFHLSTAFAILRLHGAVLGKSDFDGQHIYKANFHF